ncbi:DUF1501 domain-containing protein [Enterovirga rhinocerotis]|uniref:Uncharacterized protein (DUF1501 family) n=1 Tax=Enterovirga rhinocerotis TaxID=1339210 RepID=A0A4R7C8L8_9HYPH|nr:DUF1501 domain-containing protein [Enterovirga rhinocerotis]TDR93196.1 uncharacterized protein (DUF1501 family) [Enterovirga rhinocerotis]
MTGCSDYLSRRAVLGSAGAMFAWGFAPRFAQAAGGRDTRFLCIVLRGAIDGLSAVAPLGDPAYAGLRGSIALSATGEVPALPLDGFFYLHPALPELHRSFQAKEALICHAVATGYRQRSHFDGQDVLESGQPKPGMTASGWLNRLVAQLPAGSTVRGNSGLAVGTVPPLVLRGPAPIVGWAPPVIGLADDDLAERVLSLYRQRDRRLADVLERGLDVRRTVMESGRAAERMDGNPGTPGGMRTIARGAARLLAAPDGPRVAAMAFEGWDTHANEGGAKGRLAHLLGGLDQALVAIRTELQEHWKDTVVMVVTEFGRTARVNGTVGTDHGTGTIALLVGGCVNGGRVISDWPGLKPGDLHDGRDLKPTLDVRALASGLFADLFGVSRARLGEVVFPETIGLRPVSGLIV